MILRRAFYMQEVLTVARNLLGKTLVHETPHGTLAGKIVETEAYLGPEDKASHAYNNKRTPRTQTQFGEKGHAYIYFIYGLYYCFNVTAGNTPEKPECVFFRAIEPTQGIEFMNQRRPAAKGNPKKLANGPSKLCMALDLTKKQNGIDMCQPPLYILDEGETVADDCVVAAPRIGVDYADDWKHKPWRFYIKDNPYVSVKTKTADTKKEWG
ncbi:MAG: DNA-3-methyladenine glycosylase [Candidatus Bathyarchaeota archaeon]|nr:DNA-3-methyladenine glycosylase [Candidatus Bathyarchaeota archaeon]